MSKNRNAGGLSNPAAGPAQQTAGDPASKVTLRTVARHLGLSVTTVSRALKNGPEVQLATREKVASAAEALGYRPHLAGINLRTGRTHAVGVFLPLERSGEINNLGGALIEGVSAYLTGVSYRTTVVPVLEKTSALRAVQDIVREKSVDGIIIKNTLPQDERVRYLLEVGFPFVTFGRTELFTPHPFFDIDHESIGYRAAKLLFDAGHRQPILVAPPRQQTYSQQFLRGWRAAHFDANRDYSESHVFFSAVTPNSGRDVAGLLLRPELAATGAFIAGEESAMGVVAGLYAAGCVVGRDFGIVTYGGTQLHGFVTPPLSAFIHSNFETGERLAALLMRSIQGESAVGLGEVAEAVFVDHQSHLAPGVLPDRRPGKVA
ncbi:LacI family DNA-binding transcriptional regulator [Mesorhizobium sp. BR1-1-16]|uniref:LacI family DNA-binding transcriptional regulator n=1 Tax=Mesorhizobium sp. BR1-1-16 TaxID=2876653 RepID=UPI001CCF042C|nr:LacI family DNA-binding transcriptional regulator [Mesorhizobium sp. BR1-1-16]MBZ9937203.1 LacI family DNA-binding transcriptional regulator [Mesorhizobium sp. BR1-1-16]